MTNSKSEKEKIFYFEDEFNLLMNNFVHEKHDPENICEFNEKTEFQYQKKDMVNIIEQIKSLPPQVKQYTHKTQLSELEKIRNISDNTKGRAIPFEKLALDSMLEVVNFYEEMTGYDVRWVFELHRKATISAQSGRKNKYSNKEREINNLFIKLLTERNASEKQAMKLLIKLRGSKIVSEAGIRELQNTYRDFKKLSQHKNKICLIENLNLVVDMISSFKFHPEIFEDDYNEISYEKAILAFKELSTEFIEMIDGAFGGDEYYNYILIKWSNFEESDIEKVFNNPVYQELESTYNFIDYCIGNYVNFREEEALL